MKKKKQTLLWQISHSKLSGNSYILGTMHIKLEKNENWTVPIIEKIKTCQAFATEFDLSKVSPKAIQQFSQLTDNQMITDFISEKKLQKLERILLKSTGLPIRSLLKFKPIFILNLLIEKMLSQAQTVSMDAELWELSAGMGKKLEGIETFEEQLAILNKIPIKHQVKSLLQAGRNIKKFRKNLLKMSRVYETGDVQKIHKVAKNGLGGIRKLIIYDRNELMANRIFEKIQEKTIFCAIGAGHLGGKKGILRLLKQKGLTLQPVVI